MPDSPSTIGGRARGDAPEPATEPSATTSRARVAVLAVGTFAVGTDAFVVAGILGDVSRSLHVSVAQAGQLVTVFAVAYALLSPLLAALTGTWPRRRLLLTALGVFATGNVATALAPTFGLVLAARVLAAAGATLVTPQSSVAAASLVAPQRRARAIALATSGLTVSTALGAPLGTAVGAALGWRATMWLVAALGVAAAAAVRLALPPVPTPPATTVRQRLAPLADRRVLAVLATTLAVFTGVYLVYTYVSVVFAGATGSDGTLLAALLFAFGVSATVGNFVAGAVADRVGARAVVGAATAVLIAVCLLLPAGGSSLPGAVALIVVYGAAAFAITGPQQHRLMSVRPDGSALVVSLNASFLYLAVSVSGALGGAVVTVLGGAWIGPVAAVFLAAAVALSELAHRASRRGR